MCLVVAFVTNIPEGLLSQSDGRGSLERGGGDDSDHPVAFLVIFARPRALVESTTNQKVVPWIKFAPATESRSILFVMSASSIQYEWRQGVRVVRHNNADVAQGKVERFATGSDRSGPPPVTESDAIRLAQRMAMDGEVHTVLRQHHVATHVRDDTTESQRTGRQGGMRRVTTRTTKHTTTISRGETLSVTENVAKLDGPGNDSYSFFTSSERDASRYEEKVQVPALTYRPIPPQRTHRRSKVDTSFPDTKI